MTGNLRDKGRADSGPPQVRIEGRGGVAKLADARDLGSLGHKPWGFESLRRHPSRPRACGGATGGKPATADTWLEIGKNANGPARAARGEGSAGSQAGCSRLRRGYGEPRRSF